MSMTLREMTFQPRRPFSDTRTLDDLRAVADFISTLWQNRYSVDPRTLARLEEELRRYIADEAGEGDRHDN